MVEKVLYSVVDSVVTEGKPAEELIKAINDHGSTVLNTLLLDDLMPGHGDPDDYITYYVKAELIDDPNAQPEEVEEAEWSEIEENDEEKLIETEVVMPGESKE